MLIDSLVWILEEILQAVMAVGRRMNRRGQEAVRAYVSKSQVLLHMN